MRVRRGTAAHRRVHPHVPVESDPDCCQICNLPIGKPPYRSELHLDAPPAVDPDITAAEHRKLGEHD